MARLASPSLDQLCTSVCHSKPVSVFFMRTWNEEASIRFILRESRCYGCIPQSPEVTRSVKRECSYPWLQLKWDESWQCHVTLTMLAGHNKTHIHHSEVLY